MKTSFKLFSIWGIDVNVHISLLLILFLLTYVFYVSDVPYGFANYESGLASVLSFVAAVLVFVSVLLHEFAHSLVAMRYGVSVKGIVLFIFGGISMMEKIPENPREEFFISIAGPATSFAISAICWVMNVVVVAFSSPLSTLLYLIAYINLFLAIFNLIPAFPMDGGRVFRSILARRMSYIRATRIAAETGKMIAVFMGIFGIFYSPWLILIALFIYMGANEEEKVVMLERLLGRYRVADIMSRDVVTISPNTRVGDAIELMLRTKHLGYPVVEDGRLVGIVTLKDVMGADPSTEISEVMTRDVVTISPDASAFQALKIMNERRIGRLPVVQNGKLVGILSRSDLVRIAEILEHVEVFGWNLTR